MPHRLTLARMAQLIRQRKLSPVELVEALLKQIERRNPRLNAFIEIYDEQARAAALSAADRLAAGDEPGHLFGIPVTIKDSLDIAGRFTSCGSLLRRGICAECHSAPVERLLEAGAIVLGKTSTPEFLYYYETDNRLIGRTSNPWNPEWTAGGSSGGEASAIASLMSPGGVGSDGGGSIREPAHFCGIVGLKPTPGRVPAFGHWPEIAPPTGFMGVAGPMARTVGDVELLFSVLAGPDARDPYSHEPAPPVMPAGKPRIAVLRQAGPVPVQPRCREAVDRAASLLAAEGYSIEEFDFSLIDGAFELWRFLFVDWTAPGVRGFINGRESDCSWTGLELLSLVQDQAAPTRDQLDSVLCRQAAMRRTIADWMAGGILILMPGFGTTAFPHRQNRFETASGPIGLLDAVRTVAPANVLGLPSLVVPVLAGDGQAPAGVQLMGPPDSEEILFEIGKDLEEARGPLPWPRLS